MNHFSLANVGDGPVPDEVVTEHLGAFAASFIDGSRRNRWAVPRLRIPRHSREVMPKFHFHCDPRRCTLLEGNDTLADSLVRRFGDQLGMYFDENAETRVISLRCATMTAAKDESDAIFSITPGILALFISHDGVVWICRRRNGQSSA